MKKLTSFIAVVLIASFAFTACGNSSSSIQSDAKKLADITCRYQKLATKAGQGDMSDVSEYTKLASESATLSSEMQKKYSKGDAKEYSIFLEAYNKAVAECK